MVCLNFRAAPHLIRVSCSPDPFYQSSGELDSLRVPLIEPYEAIKIDDSGWFIELDSDNLNEFFYNGINGASKIAIMENRIYVYSDYERLDGINIELKKFHWFVLNTVSNTEIAFEAEEEFVQYQLDNRYEDPQWITIDDAFKEFETTGCLAWVPGCEKIE